MTLTGNRTSLSSEGGTLLLFGSQALSFDAEAFAALRASVWGTGEQQWVGEALASLAGCWDGFLQAFPKYKVDSGARELLADLDKWFRTGVMRPGVLDGAGPRVPNIVLSPLVIIAQLVGYMRWQLDETAAPVLGTLGFCTGLLSAYAVALGKDKTQVRTHGATAVRLAMLIGGIVDAQESLDPSGPATALATAWSSPAGGQELNRLLHEFPDSYISVSYDESRATVTTAAATASKLEQALRAAGLVASEIGLHGRFHHAWYKDDMDLLVAYCDREASLRLPDAAGLLCPTWSGWDPDDASKAGAAAAGRGPLHAHALHTILANKSEWHRRFEMAVALAAPDRLATLRLTSFGPERCVPPSAMRRFGPRATHIGHLATSPGGSGAQAAAEKEPMPEPRKADDVAIVGVSIKVAGADDVDEFWELLCRGASQHQEVPGSRLSFDNVWRAKDESRKWFGNFIADHDAFDHRFFKKTPREMASVDPQQRHMLQVAYQAVEQSGYFGVAPDRIDKKVGCFVGVCSADYENNMACHEPNAFTAVGNLKSFIAGKISHWFGWLGPSLCIDTACSSSLVAVHQACRAVLGGDCSAALAGGANIMTNSLWFQNLAAGGFLSPTGACKPFDAKADGYCRGEGFAAVMVKTVARALADGDQILATISSSAVYQNQNCTPVFVPNSPSLSDLFADVVAQARLDPGEITVVEAHGTGTQVGDPAEYASVKDVLGGPRTGRTEPLALGSVKGLVGHTECASGAVSLVKTLLMTAHRMIPPSASFDTLNPAIAASPDDKIHIAARLEPWVVPDGGVHAALINNYGASGSNASMVVTGAPRARPAKTRDDAPGVEYPFRIFGADERAIKAYCGRLVRFLTESAAFRGAGAGAGADAAPSLANTAPSLANTAFNVSRQANPTLDKALVFAARSVEQLVQKLAAFEKGSTEGTNLVSASQKPARPVILCFGGQVSTFVGLDRGVYSSSRILRQHLGAVDAVCASLAGSSGSIFPAIFQRTPVDDPVRLQTALFALQYASARSWIDCGLAPAAVVGHSFGELVALAVSGTLSLRDALRVVVGRATVIREAWGADKGSMAAVEGDLAAVGALLARAGGKATIACYNGPRSFTVAGTAAEIDAVVETLGSSADFASTRCKRLSVTNAFHSTLVEPLVPRLVEIGQTLAFSEDPHIPLERAVESGLPQHTRLTANYVAEHMRNPVFFSHAIQRIAERYPGGCVFLEAGSNSTITGMASRALGAPRESHFQAVNITGDGGNGPQMLANATLGLWKEGLRTAVFWPHHRVQTYEYTPLLLPPYQFERSRHWLDMKAPPKPVPLPAETRTPDTAAPPLGLFSFVEHRDGNARAPVFRINTQAQRYLDYVSGHFIAKTAAICPATLIVDMAVEALASVRPDLLLSQDQSSPPAYAPQIHQVSNQAAICLDASRTVSLRFASADDNLWHWQVVSTGNDPDRSGGETLHALGQLVLARPDDGAALAEFKRYERLTGHHAHCAAVLDGSGADDMIHGARNIYRAFAEVVDYPSPYRGVQRLVGRGFESAGRVVKRAAPGGGWLDTHLADSFSQVAGIWVNCMTDADPGDMYIAVGFEKWLRSPLLGGDEYKSVETWDVLARHERVGDKAFLSDIFVFEAESGKLAEVILGVNYHQVSKLSMSKMLARLTPGLAVPVAANAAAAAATRAAKHGSGDALPAPPAQTRTSVPQLSVQTEVKAAAAKGPAAAPAVDVVGKIRTILGELSGLEPGEISIDANLADLGIDSLMGMELGREMEGAFKARLMSDELASVLTFRELVAHVAGVLGVADGPSGGDHEDTGDSEVDDGDSTSSTPPTSFSPTPPLAAQHEHVKAGAAAAAAASRAVADGLGGSEELHLSPAAVFEAFEETKRLTDDLIAQYGCAGYMDTVLPRLTQLCIALALEACEQLGCRIAAAAPGERLPRIPHMLADAARLVDVSPSTGVVTRTAASAAPYKASASLRADLLRAFPEHESVIRLTFFAGSRLADVLRGEQDGIKLIFGTDDGRRLVTGLYGDSLLNNLANAQMRDVLARVVARLPSNSGPLKMLELGAGTGGTTKDMVPMLAALGVPVEYTFTDLSGSFVAAARKKFGAQYPFMKFRVHDIEKAPAPELGRHHVVIGSNAIHATRNLRESVAHVRQALRPDGFLLMLEMTQPVYWVDIIFGLFEGWWRFEDGRTHAIAHQSRWQADLHAAGYGRVDWTDGWRPEIEIQRIIVAQASASPGFPLEPTRIDFPAPPPPAVQTSMLPADRALLDGYVQKYAAGFDMPPRPAAPAATPNDKSLRQPLPARVAVTGATGSLGAHLVAHLASLPHVETVFCLNRRSTTGEPSERQQDAFTSRGITLTPSTQAKLRILAVDSTKPCLGLARDVYASLTTSVTHIIHNAWPMTGKRPASALEPQFAAMRHLLDLARDAALAQTPQTGNKIAFQLVSSIAVMGHHHLTGSRLAPEARAAPDDVLPNGYAHAKWVCERMVDAALHNHAAWFRACVVRPGQIAGNSASGAWNENEHLAFLVKSSQTLRALPALGGELCWTPVEAVAGAVADLVLLGEETHMAPVYHVDNPVRQPWGDVLGVMREELGVQEVVPFDAWVRRVRAFPGSMDDNPAARLIDFLDENFVRMSCGGMLLDTKKACEHSATMRAVGPVSKEVVKRYLEWWKLRGFLHATNGDGRRLR
ncbi:hypothetical protein B0T26DRAFT_742197 [Lasiosphaeria miniovina]|uniref:Uncharacterized protein n=1 Tax=Lasiosphaeria miniovina TaxID=1954250 RepID=A0AA40ACW8_9PEZI|nr:uncharacterized protein B0T26DRAFT_742197 [Lasiosphaeria miniovina]KAK0713573.1 hypothetical protein B0T26DRAFT_742197 [Lasiosphaeria miniovina]